MDVCAGCSSLPTTQLTSPVRASEEGQGRRATFPLDISLQATRAISATSGWLCMQVALLSIGGDVARARAPEDESRWQTPRRLPPLYLHGEANNRNHHVLKGPGRELSPLSVLFHVRCTAVTTARDYDHTQCTNAHTDSRELRTWCDVIGLGRESLDTGLGFDCKAGGLKAPFDHLISHDIV